MSTEALTNEERGAARPQGRRALGLTDGRFGRLLEAYALLLFLIGIAAFFSLWPETSDTFPTSANIKVLLSSQAVVAVIALGVLIPLVCFEFDLSVGAVAGLSAITVANVLGEGTSFPLALLIALGLGAGVGAINAAFVTGIGVAGVVATLGTATLAAGAIQQQSKGQPLTGDVPPDLTSFATGEFLGLPNIFLTLLVIAGLTYFLLEHTPFGRQLYALGSNATAAELVGLRTRRLLALSFVIAAVLASAAGFLYVARSGGADPQVGPGFLLPAFAAAFLSAASVKPGRYNVMGTLIAIYFLAVLNNGLTLAGAQPYVTSYVNGGALLLGVSLATILYRRRRAGQ